MDPAVRSFLAEHNLEIFSEVFERKYHMVGIYFYSSFSINEIQETGMVIPENSSLFFFFHVNPFHYSINQLS